METRILLVDPHVVVREALGTLLADREGLRLVGQVSDGIEALEEFERLRPNLVVLELTLPRFPGLEVLRYLQEIAPDVGTLVLTAIDTRREVRGALHAGATGFLLKTSSSEELFDAIDAVREGRRYVSPAVLNHIVLALGPDGEPIRSPLTQLTAREREVLQLIAEGLSAREVGERLGISVSTVGTHRSRLMEKLGVRKSVDLVRLAIREGLVEL